MEENNSKKIKICYVVSADITIKFLLLPQLKFLVREGYDIYVICPDGKWISDIKKEGINIKIIRIKRKISPFYDLISVYRMWSYFQKEKFDIVHTHNPKPGLLGQISAKIARVPIVINTVHGFYFQKNSSLVKRKFFIVIERVAARFSDLIFFVNKEDMQTALDEKICDNWKIKYFGGGINLDKFEPKKFTKEITKNKKKELNIPEGFKIVGIIARLVEEKGILDLFEAFRIILESFPKTILAIVGPKEPEKKDAINPEVVKKYNIDRKVIFLGERTDVDEIYPLLDVFVLPSYREGLGISILEASAMGKPVIATDIRGCREAVDDNKTGILIPIKNPRKLANAINYFLKNQKIAEEMGRNGRMKVIKEFDEKLVFNRIKENYEELIRNKLK